MAHEKSRPNKDGCRSGGAYTEEAKPDQQPKPKKDKKENNKKEGDK